MKTGTLMIKVEVYYAPKTEKAFKQWCKESGFDYIGGDRRAWCSKYQTYFRDSLGIAFTSGGEEFLFNNYDIKE